MSTTSGLIFSNVSVAADTSLDRIWNCVMDCCQLFFVSEEDVLSVCGSIGLSRAKILCPATTDQHNAAKQMHLAILRGSIGATSCWTCNHDGRDMYFDNHYDLMEVCGQIGVINMWLVQDACPDQIASARAMHLAIRSGGKKDDAVKIVMDAGLPPLHTTRPVSVG